MIKKETIILKNITKSFISGEQKIPILKNISLTAYENELVMLMGPSGSGKTTLISIIGGILSQDSGECIILNQPINNLPTNEKTSFRGNNIGFIFQHFMLIPTLNCIENAAIPLLCLQHERTQAFEIARQFLINLDLEKQLEKSPNKLSGGEQQRVAIARACLHNPKIILCDEPTSFLDLERGKKIMNILKTIQKNNNCTIIVITHDPRIIDYADTLMHIEDGIIKK